MRVVIVSGIFPPDIGGPATHAWDVAEVLRARGHDGVVVVSLTDGHTPSRTATSVLFPRHWFWPRRTGAVVAWLVRNRRSYDAVYATGLGPAAVAGARLARRPVVLKIVADPAWERSSRLGLTSAGFDEFQHRRGGSPRVRAMRAVRNWTVRHADAVVTPGIALAAAVGSWTAGRQRVQVVPNGVVFPEGAPNAGVVPGVDDDPGEGLALLWVGRLVPVKRVEVLIGALALSPGTRLDLVGEGPERARLESLVATLGVGGRARFLGPLPHREVMGRMRGCDAVVGASSHEGLPHVLIEALACGRPIVTAPAPGTSEVVEDGVNGLVVDPPGPEGFAKCFELLAGDAGLRAGLARGARESAGKWDFERTADAIESVLREVVGRRGPAASSPETRPTVVFVGRGAAMVPAAKQLVHARHIVHVAGASPRLRPRALSAALAYGLVPARAVVRAGRAHGAVVCQSPYEAVAALAVRRALPRRARPRVQVELHGDWRTASRLYGSRWRRALAPTADRAAAWALRQADRVRVVSGVLEAQARQAGYRGLVDRHPAFSDYSVFLGPTAPLPERPVAIFVGSLERAKGVDVLLDAWPAVQQRVDGAELLVVGSGRLASQVRRRIGAGGISARLTGRVGQAELAELLDSATCLVLPSRSEGYGRVVVEAQARGRAVVASAVGGVPELVPPGTGRLVAPGDPGALAGALVEVLGDPERARRMGAEGRRHVDTLDPAGQYEAGIVRLARWAQGQ